MSNFFAGTHAFPTWARDSIAASDGLLYCVPRLSAGEHARFLRF